MPREGAEGREGPQPGVDGLPVALAARVDAIVRAAEQEAAAVQHELVAQRQAAETEAQRYLADARSRADALAHERMQRLHELTDDLIERAEAAARQLEELMAALKRTTAAIETDAPDNQPAPAKPLAAPVARETAPGVRDVSAARLVAIEMAVAGRTRDEVDRHLRESFDVDDTRALLDDVFGGARSSP
jgi:small-conductance mechanosensitive channel